MVHCVVLCCVVQCGESSICILVHYTVLRYISAYTLYICHTLYTYYTYYLRYSYHTYYTLTYTYVGIEAALNARQYNRALSLVKLVDDTTLSRPYYITLGII